MQGQGQLRTTENEYCCLGVLADIECKTWYPNDTYGWGLAEAFNDGESNNDNIVESASIEYEGPNNVLKIDHLFDPENWRKNASSVLIGLNDNDEADFNEIADWIEANLDDELRPNA